jgi:hypothetical protein
MLILGVEGFKLVEGVIGHHLLDAPGCLLSRTATPAAGR